MLARSRRVSSTLAASPVKTEAQIEYEERLQLEQSGPGPESDAGGDATGLSWDNVGLAVLGPGALATGGAITFHPGSYIAGSLA